MPCGMVESIGVHLSFLVLWLLALNALEKSAEHLQVVLTLQGHGRLPSLTPFISFVAL